MKVNITKILLIVFIVCCFSLFIFDCSIKEGNVSSQQCVYDSSSGRDDLVKNTEGKKDEAKSKEDEGGATSEKIGDFLGA